MKRRSILKALLGAPAAVVAAAHLPTRNATSPQMKARKVTTPAMRFVFDTETGLFRIGRDEIGIAAGGVELFRFKPRGA